MAEREGPRRSYHLDEALRQRGKVVLVVDDSGMMRHLVSEIVRDIGFDAVEATGGDEAVALASFYEPRLVILDIQMPGGSGLVALERMRDDDKLRETPVIMVTVEAFRGSLESAQSLGVLDYIIKPVNADDLRTRMQKLLAG